MTSELVRGDGLFPPAAYAREDESSDGSFYANPRKVVHIDEGAIAALGRLYADVLPTGGRLLDLMSSWRSHLPAGFAAGEVVGLGLNADEMADNPKLTRALVHDVNDDPRLPFEDGFEAMQTMGPRRDVIDIETGQVIAAGQPLGR